MSQTETSIQITSHLTKIYENLVDFMSEDAADQISEFIEVREWDLALDELAAIALKIEHYRQSLLYADFAAAASLMNMKPGDLWTAVHQLLAKGQRA